MPDPRWTARRAYGVLAAPSRTAGLAMAAGAYLAWGLLSPGNAIILEEMGPLWMQATRATLALLVLALWLRRRLLQAARALARPGLPLALWLGTVASFLLFTISQTRIEPAHTTLGFLTAPLWTALVVWAWGEGRPRRAFLPAVALMAIGGAMVVGVRGAPADAFGLALAVASGATWALYGVLLRRHLEVPWQDLLAASILVSVPMFLLVALLWEPVPDWTALSGRAWRWTGVQVLVPTLVAIALYQSSLRRIGPTTANLFVGLELVGAVFWSWILLGTGTGWAGAAGVALVVAAVTGYLWDSARAPAQP